MVGCDGLAWDICACGVDIADMEERMKAFALEGIECRNGRSSERREAKLADVGEPTRGRCR
jgi:hypothetical protein